MVLIEAFTCIDGIDLYEFDEGGNSAEVLVVKIQLLLNAWHQVLKVTSRELKLSKYYWTLQDHE